MAKEQQKSNAGRRSSTRKTGAQRQNARKNSRKSASAASFRTAWCTSLRRSTTRRSPSPTPMAAPSAGPRRARSASRVRAKARLTPRSKPALAAAGIARDQYGMKSVEVRVKGPGSGRESAVRALAAAGSAHRRDPRRHADSAQRLPSAKAPQSLRQRSPGRRPEDWPQQIQECRATKKFWEGRIEVGKTPRCSLPPVPPGRAEAIFKRTPLLHREVRD